MKRLLFLTLALNLFTWTSQAQYLLLKNAPPIRVSDIVNFNSNETTYRVICDTGFKGNFPTAPDSNYVILKRKNSKSPEMRFNAIQFKTLSFFGEAPSGFSFSLDVKPSVRQTSNINIQGIFNRVHINNSSYLNELYLEEIADTVEISGGYDTLEIAYSSINTFISNPGINVEREFSIHDSAIGKLDLSPVSSLPDTLTLMNLIIKDGIYDNGYLVSKKCVLFLERVDFEKIHVSFNKFDLCVSPSQNYELQLVLYQSILKRLRDDGLSEMYEVQDKRFQSLKLLYDHHWFLNWLSKAWWDYGYDKGRIFLWSLGLFTFFFICNICSLNQLRLVYFPEKFLIKEALRLQQKENSQKLKAFFIQIPGTFLYTTYIFWGLKLDLKKVEIKNWWAILLILVQYVLGVVCVAYLANYVISK